MQFVRVRCPSCGVVLKVPVDRLRRRARCAQCKTVYRLPTRTIVAEALIASWLARPEDEEEAPRSAPQPGAARVQAAKPRPAAKVARGEIRLVQADARGALFEFPTHRLTETAFRCSMPRRCLQCGISRHLRAHVIIYVPILRERPSLRAEHSAGDLVVRDEDIQQLEGEALLDRLPRVPNVPPPGDMPMPYWLCDMCGEAGATAGQIQVNPQTGEGRCRLLIRNLRRAEEFLSAAGGRNSPDHDTLLALLETMTEDPWDTLPLVVRHRLEQWFRPAGDERLVAYVPNRDHARTEDGVSGLVISNRRLIYHSHSRHHEASVTEPLEMQLATGGGRTELRFRTRSWQVKHFRADRSGLRQLRRALAAARYRVTWR